MELDARIKNYQKNKDFLLEIVNEDAIIIREFDTYRMVDYINRHLPIEKLREKIQYYGFDVNC